MKTVIASNNLPGQRCDRGPNRKKYSLLVVWFDQNLWSFFHPTTTFLFYQGLLKLWATFLTSAHICQWWRRRGWLSTGWPAVNMTPLFGCLLSCQQAKITSKPQAMQLYAEDDRNYHNEKETQLKSRPGNYWLGEAGWKVAPTGVLPCLTWIY